MRRNSADPAAARRLDPGGSEQHPVPADVTDRAGEVDAAARHGYTGAGSRHVPGGLPRAAPNGVLSVAGCGGEDSLRRWRSRKSGRSWGRWSLVPGASSTWPGRAAPRTTRDLGMAGCPALANTHLNVAQACPEPPKSGAVRRSSAAQWGATGWRPPLVSSCGFPGDLGHRTVVAVRHAVLRSCPCHRADGSLPPVRAQRRTVGGRSQAPPPCHDRRRPGPLHAAPRSAPRVRPRRVPHGPRRLGRSTVP